jgi:hypothetical protein
VKRKKENQMTTNIFETIVNALATQVADKACAMVEQRVKLLSEASTAGLLASLLVDTDAFKNAVKRSLDTEAFESRVQAIVEKDDGGFLDSHQFIGAVKAVVSDEFNVEEAIEEAIENHERNQEHLSMSDITDDSDFQSSVETAISESEALSDVRDELETEIADLRDQVDNINEDEAFVKRLAKLLAMPENRKLILAALSDAQQPVTGVASQQEEEIQNGSHEPSSLQSELPADGPASDALPF